MSNPTPTQRILTERELAARLGISLPTLKRWRYTRSAPIAPLPGLGKLIRYSEAEVERYLQGRKR